MKVFSHRFHHFFFAHVAPTAGALLLDVYILSHFSSQDFSLLSLTRSTPFILLVRSTPCMMAAGCRVRLMNELVNEEFEAICECNPCADSQPTGCCCAIALLLRTWLRAHLSPAQHTMQNQSVAERLRNALCLALSTACVMLFVARRAVSRSVRCICDDGVEMRRVARACVRASVRACVQSV